LSVYVDAYGTNAPGVSDRKLNLVALRCFDLRPGCIIRDLNLKRPIYRKTAGFGHFGRNDEDFTWEKVIDIS
jgi:S-adenosylmethionine synthetase